MQTKNSHHQRFFCGPNSQNVIRTNMIPWNNLKGSYERRTNIFKISFIDFLNIQDMRSQEWQTKIFNFRDIASRTSGYKLTVLFFIINVYPLGTYAYLTSLGSCRKKTSIESLQTPSNVMKVCGSNEKYYKFRYKNNLKNIGIIGSNSLF